MNISTVVFDFDGTLVDSNDIKDRGFFDVVVGEPGGTSRMQAVLSSTKGSRHMVFESYVASRARSGFEGPEAGALEMRYSFHVDARVSDAPEMPGAFKILSLLRNAGLKLFISSATPQANLKSIIERRRWNDLFDGFFGCPNRKSDTLRAICFKLGVHPCSVAVVGDGLDDLESAIEVGCRFFPVGQARGSSPETQIFTLQEVADELLSTSATKNKQHV